MGVDQNFSASASRPAYKLLVYALIGYSSHTTQNTKPSIKSNTSPTKPTYANSSHHVQPPRHPRRTSHPSRRSRYLS